MIMTILSMLGPSRVLPEEAQHPFFHITQSDKGWGAQWANPGHYKKVKVDQKQNRMQVYAKKLYFT